ncbi:DNA-binding protein [Candidatus Woesearchaeota archaeon]|nr:DNA-binding protein [Candidatus Woesearchaeota archaeon]
MKVNELKDKTAVDEIVLKIKSKEEPRDVRGGSLRVCNAKGEDDTGEVTITLWNDDIDKVKEGDTIKITKGWSQIYNGTMQVSAGRMGKLEVVESS